MINASLHQSQSFQSQLGPFGSMERYTMKTGTVATVATAAAALCEGASVIIVDGTDDGGKGTLVHAAQHATIDEMAFALQHTSKIVCVALTSHRLGQLQIPPMAITVTDPDEAKFMVSVDSLRDTTTGISAADRAVTARALASPATQPNDLARPGHVFPIKSSEGGVLHRPRHTEASVDLMIAAGLRPAAVTSMIMQPNGNVANRRFATELAQTYGIPLVSIPDIIGYRLRYEKLVQRVAESTIATPYGPVRGIEYNSILDENTHAAYIWGNPSVAPDVLVSVHEECVTGEILGSHNCGCGHRLDAAKRRLRAAGSGTLIYIRRRSGGGIGLAHEVERRDDKTDFAQLHDSHASFNDYTFIVAAQMLRDLGIATPTPLTDQPTSCNLLRTHDLLVRADEPLNTSTTAQCHTDILPGEERTT
jgi:3,4-dihydroxy 2-butanone 4-phosphate synthase/GTP cyclohydrolase II